MKIGLIGLGRMGYGLTLNAAEHNQKLVVYNRSLDKVKKISKKKNIQGASSLEDLVNKLPKRKIIWLMVPAGKTVDVMIKKLVPLLKRNDILVDGGNSFYLDTISRAKALAKKGVIYLDIGTSGGIRGARYGACMMAGGNKQAFKVIEPFVKATCVKNGYGYMGESGLGHYVKMIHNAIEYGMMQAIGEGYEMLNRFNKKIDLHEVSKVYAHGSVIRSWLIDLVRYALEKDPQLKAFSGKVDHSGEGVWAVKTAKQLKINIPVITASLRARFISWKNPNFGSKIISAMREGFGGHKEKF